MALGFFAELKSFQDLPGSTMTNAEGKAYGEDGSVDTDR